MNWIKPRRRQSSDELFKVLTIDVRENRRTIKIQRHRNINRLNLHAIYIYHIKHILKDQLFRNMTLELIVLDHLIPKCMDARDILHFLFHKNVLASLKLVPLYICSPVSKDIWLLVTFIHFSFPKNIPARASFNLICIAENLLLMLDSVQLLWFYFYSIY